MSSPDTKHVVPLTEPEISGNEWEYIKECLDTGWVSSVGSYVTRFEEMTADYIGTKYAVAIVNGTSALHLSLLVCDIKPGDEVIVPALTFIAPVNAVRYCGAYPVFMDCDAEFLGMDVAKVARFISSECTKHEDGYCYNKKTGRRVKAVIPVHVFGHPVDMNGLVDICKENNIDIIEDASESIGSEYKGKKTGTFGKMGCFSYNGNKIITTGGGGMIVTDNKGLAQRVQHLSTQAKSHPVEYDHDEIGYNYRLTNIQAAMGVAQMERLDEFVEIKRKNAAVYRERLSGSSGVDFLWEQPWAKSNFWLYSIRVPKDHKKGLMQYLLSKNIQTRPVWMLIHTLPMYKDFQAYDIERAMDIYNTVLNVPCALNLRPDEIDFITDSIKGYFKKS